VRVAHAEEAVHRRPAVKHGGPYAVGRRDGSRHYDHAQHCVRYGLLDEVSNERLRRVCVTHFAVLIRTVRALRGRPVWHGESVDGFRPGFAEPAEVPVRPDTLAAHRARLLTVVATLACLRVNEVARLQVCDLWFDYLMSYGLSGFESVHINRRKNNTQRKGHYPAFGRSRDPELDVVAQLRRWLELAGLAVHPLCAKRARPAAACELCPPLFPLTHCAKGGINATTRRPCSRQQASDWIRWAVKQAGGDSSRFSGISARKGGISTAIEARVDETILYLQSGHGAALPAQAYMQISSPARFLERFEAFGL
jgi:hypothetical protein